MDRRLILAVRPPEEGKSRLAETLSLRERISLNHNMFSHVLSIGRQVLGADHVIVVSRSSELLDEARSAGALGLSEEGDGLNAALEQAARHAISRGAQGLLSLSIDLPWLEADDLRAMLDAASPIAIAADRHGEGTNALAMRPAGAIAFHYGPGSLAAHLAAAREAGLAASVIERPGLARDLDTPADLAEWRSR